MTAPATTEKTEVKPAKMIAQPVQPIGPTDTFDVQILGKFKASEWVNGVKQEKVTHANLKCGLVGMYSVIWIQATNDKASQMMEMNSYKVTVSLNRSIIDKGIMY